MRKFCLRPKNLCRCSATESGPYGCLSQIIQTHGLTILGDVDVSSCVALTALPDGLSISGDLNAGHCLNLSSLPENLSIGGSLSLSFCKSLSSLPLRLYVAGELDLACTGLVCLPKDINVGGGLCLCCCVKLKSLPDGLRVEGDLDLRNCSSLAVLPDNLCVRGYLNLHHCDSLVNLPTGLTVQGMLDLSWTPIAGLPDDITVLGSLRLWHCTSLVSLPGGLHVGGHLHLELCYKLVTLPEKLKVDGSLRLNRCYSLTSLPQDVSFSGDLELRNCDKLISLPNDLTVMGDLFLGSYQLTSLPDRLRVLGSLFLDSCKSLSHLPATVHVQRDLELRNWFDLTSLPDDLVVLGNFTLVRCISLSRLPPRLKVAGNLKAIDCRSLVSLPEGLSIGGDLDLTGCTSLTSLPQDIVTWGQASPLCDRLIDITKTGISEQVRARIAACAPSGLRFVYGEQETQTHAHHYRDLPAALTAWLLPGSVASTRTCHLGTEQQQLLCQFLSRLQDTAEYRNSQTRPSLRKRVATLLEEMQQSHELTDLCGDRISHALESCTDRVMLIMNQLEVAVQVHKAQKSLLGEKELKMLGIGLLKLDVVHRHASATCHRLTFVDEVEVFLKYETKLRDALQLPISTSEMLYGAEVTLEELDAARQEATSAATDPEQREAFFAAWEPWLKHERMKAALAYDFDKLPIQRISPRSLEGLICPITQEPLSKLRQPVSLQATNRPRVYESVPFLAWWREHGREPAPAPQSDVHLSELWRVQIVDLIEFQTSQAKDSLDDSLFADMRQSSISNTVQL